MVESSTRNPIVSLQGILLPANGNSYAYRTQVLSDFRKGRPFTHDLLGVQMVVSLWDYAEGDMIKFRYSDGAKACFYRVTKSDLTGAK